MGKLSNKRKKPNQEKYKPKPEQVLCFLCKKVTSPMLNLVMLFKLGKEHYLHGGDCLWNFLGLSHEISKTNIRDSGKE